MAVILSRLLTHCNWFLVVLFCYCTLCDFCCRSYDNYLFSLFSLHS